jgi:hypothetical protein
MSVELICHTDTPPHNVHSVAVDASCDKQGQMWLRYHVECDLESLQLPNEVDPGRSDDLWKTTCFEAFIANDSKKYAELNFAPSSLWAAYIFDGYRVGMRPLQLPCDPVIGLDASDSHFALEADLRLPTMWAGHDLRLALSAVIEEIDGTKSYWALAHPAGPPDFHHPDCFALTLDAPSE